MRCNRPLILTLLGGFALCSFPVFAYAQSVGSNEVYLGQTGNTNTITIDQSGGRNLIGEKVDEFRLNQLGDNNAIVGNQYGYANAIGSRLRVGTYADNGLNQRGDHNDLAIDQTNTSNLSSNHLDAISQQALSSRTTVGNVITVDQNDDGATGIGAGHVVGQVVQVNPTGDGAPNVATITQSGGALGAGNTVGQTWQKGFANSFTVDQRETGNAVRTITQRGSGNAIRVDENGAGNFVDIVEQGNAVTRGVGNTATLIFSSDDNGTSAPGTLGATGFSIGYDTARRPGQASVMQLGSGNLVNYTASGGPNNLYGFLQDGTGNAIAAISSGTGNQVAVMQVDDGNVADIDQSGDGNIAGVLQDGGSNALDISQIGDSNRVRADIVGRANNSRFGVGFTRPRLIAAAGTLGADRLGPGRLGPGDLIQHGDGNRIALDVTNDENVFAISQTGNRNQVTGIVVGSANQAVVIQSGDDNFASYSQTGSRNSVLIVQ